MKKLLIVFCFILPLTVNARDLITKDDARNIAKTAMEKVATGDIESGLMAIKPYFIFPGPEFDVMLEQYKLQAPVIERRFGKTIGIEFLEEETVGESLMKISYLQKFEQHVMCWRFFFYRPEDKWVLNTFYTNDKIRQLFNK